MNEEIKIGDIVYDIHELPEWKRHEMIVLNIYSNGTVLCDIFPSTPYGEFKEKIFYEWNLTKIKYPKMK